MSPIGRPSALDSVFRIFDDHSVSWCLLRPEPAHDEGDDVDLLVDSAERRRIGRLLDEVGFARMPEWGHGSHMFFTGYDTATDRPIHLDIVSELAYGPYFAIKTSAAAECLRRRQHAGEVWMLHPDDGFWTLLLHNLLDKQAIQQKHRDRLRRLAESAEIENPLARALDELDEPRWHAQQLLDLSRAGEWEALEGLAAGLVATLMRRHPLHSAVAFLEMRLARKAARMCSPLLLRARSRP